MPTKTSSTPTGARPIEAAEAPAALNASRTGARR